MSMQSYAGIPILTYTENHEKVAALIADLAPGSRILDLGAGKGALSQRLADMGFQVEAMDLSADGFEAESVSFTSGNINDPLPMADETYDAAVCVEALEHLENHYSVIRELHRVLKPGGRLVVTTPNIASVSSRVRFFLTGFFSLADRPINEFGWDPANDHINPLTFPKLRYILQTNGFSITHVGGAVRRGGGWYRLVVPAGRAMLRRACREEQEPRQRETNALVSDIMFSPEILFHRILIVAAQKT